MTRAEFDRYFTAGEDNTEGYSATQLARINDAVFLKVSDLDIEDDTTKSVVDHAFEAEFVKEDED